MRNKSWFNMSDKIRTEESDLDKAYDELEKVKTPDEYLKIRKEIDRLNRHIECLKVFNGYETDEIKRKKLTTYAINTTKK